MCIVIVSQFMTSQILKFTLAFYFKGLSVARSCLRPDSGRLMTMLSRWPKIDYCGTPAVILPHVLKWLLRFIG